MWRRLVRAVAMLLIAASLPPVAAPAASSPRIPDAGPVILQVAVRERDFDYRLDTPDGDAIVVRCRSFVWERVVVSAGSRGALGDHIRCGSGKPADRKLVIWIHGGPWAYAGTDLVIEQLAFLKAGYDLFVPHYPGSSDRPTVEEGERLVPDAADALAELHVALDWGRRNYDLVDVAGESFGAFLAVTLLPRLRASESLLMINPSLGGAGYLAGHYARKGGELAINGVGGEGAQAEAKRLTDGYFGRLRDYDPIRRLRAARRPNLKLIHGGADPVSVPEEIALVETVALPGCGVEFRPASGHEFGYTRQHFEAAGKLIRCRRGTVNPPAAPSPRSRAARPRSRAAPR